MQHRDTKRRTVRKPKNLWVVFVFIIFTLHIFHVKSIEAEIAAIEKEIEAHENTIAFVKTLHASSSVQESPEQEREKEKNHKPVKLATVTAYSCEGLKTNHEIHMNCPSLFLGEPTTANGTAPIPYRTMACDPANMGRVFEIAGYGTVTCTDTGGAITGAGRFDLYLPTVEEARAFGVQYLPYALVEEAR